MTATKTPRTWVSLQYVRGLAALLVVGFHVSEQMENRLGQSFLGGALRFGWCGLDLFFVLSGFIMAWIHGGEVGVPERLGAYLRKRAQRIYPLYWSLLLPATLVAFLIPQFATDRERSIDVLIRSWLLLPIRGLPLLGVAWTLCHEVFFYLMFGLLIALPRAGRWGVWTVWLTGTAIAGATVNAGRWPLESDSTSPPLWLAFLFNPLNLEFVAGCALGGWLRRPGEGAKSLSIELPARPWGLLLLLPALGILATWARLQSALLTALPPSLARAVVVGGAGLWVLAVLLRWEASRDARRSMPIFLAPLAAIGNASYSIYLVHYPLLVVAGVVLKKMDRQGAVPSLVTGFGLIALVVLAGVVWHHAVEKPILRWVRR